MSSKFNGQLHLVLGIVQLPIAKSTIPIVFSVAVDQAFYAVLHCINISLRNKGQKFLNNLRIRTYDYYENLADLFMSMCTNALVDFLAIVMFSLVQFWIYQIFIDQYYILCNKIAVWFDIANKS